MADFQARLPAFTSRDILVLGASVDGLEEAKQTVERHGLTFPVAYGLQAAEWAERCGVFFNPERGFLQAAGFVLRPDGRVGAAVYSTGPVGRYSPADCLSLIASLAKSP